MTAAHELFSLVLWFGVVADGGSASGITTVGPFRDLSDCEGTAIALQVVAGPIPMHHLCVPIVDTRPQPRRKVKR